MITNEFRALFTMTDPRGLVFPAGRWITSIETPWAREEVAAGRLEARRPIVVAPLPAVSIAPLPGGSRPHPIFGLPVEAAHVEAAPPIDTPPVGFVPEVVPDIEPAADPVVIDPVVVDPAVELVDDPAADPVVDAPPPPVIASAPKRQRIARVS